MQQFITLVTTWLCVALFAGQISAQDSHLTGFANGKVANSLSYGLGEDTQTRHVEFTSSSSGDEPSTIVSAQIINIDFGVERIQPTITWEWLPARRDNIFGLTIAGESTKTKLDNLSLSDGGRSALIADETNVSKLFVGFSSRPKW